MSDKEGARKVFLQIFMALGSPLFLLAVVLVFLLALGTGQLLAWPLKEAGFWPFDGYVDFLIREVLGCFGLSFLAYCLGRRSWGGAE